MTDPVREQVGDMQERGARGKTTGAIEGAREALSPSRRGERQHAGR